MQLTARNASTRKTSTSSAAHRRVLVPPFLFPSQGHHQTASSTAPSLSLAGAQHVPCAISHAWSCDHENPRTRPCRCEGDCTACVYEGYHGGAASPFGYHHGGGGGGGAGGDGVGSLGCGGSEDTGSAGGIGAYVEAFKDYKGSEGYFGGGYYATFWQCSCRNLYNGCRSCGKWNVGGGPPGTRNYGKPYLYGKGYKYGGGSKDGLIVLKF